MTHHAGKAASALRDIYWRRSPAASGPYRRWLTDRGSLTARIAEHCPGVRVKVMFQGLRRPDRDERFVFGHCGRAHVLVREVFLYCCDKPVVFAHTVLDRRALYGAWRSIAKLGNHPLGAALFADPRITRYPLHQRKLRPDHELYRRLKKSVPHASGSLWARRSLFALHNSPILVTEIFLPEILGI